MPSISLSARSGSWELIPGAKPSPKEPDGPPKSSTPLLLRAAPSGRLLPLTALPRAGEGALAAAAAAADGAAECGVVLPAG
jgi:hypothetical protein